MTPSVGWRSRTSRCSPTSTGSARIQYFAATRLKDRPIGGTDLLYPLLDVTTSLDPNFNIAYRFGAVFLAERRASGLGRPEQAIALLDKGFASNPLKWEYLYDKAFIYYWTYLIRRPPLTGSRKPRRCRVRPNGCPGSPATCWSRAAIGRARASCSSRSPQSAEHEYMRKIAELRLMQLDILDGLDTLNAVLDRDAATTGSRATSWESLVARGVLRRVPTDPEGVPFLIDPATGRAALAPSSKYFPLPEEPGASRAPAAGGAARQGDVSPLTFAIAVG